MVQGSTEYHHLRTKIVLSYNVEAEGLVSLEHFKEDSAVVEKYLEKIN